MEDPFKRLDKIADKGYAVLMNETITLAHGLTILAAGSANDRSVIRKGAALGTLKNNIEQMIGYSKKGETGSYYIGMQTVAADFGHVADAFLDDPIAASQLIPSMRELALAMGVTFARRSLISDVEAEKGQVDETKLAEIGAGIDALMADGETRIAFYHAHKDEARFC